jgi:hypothetical protein
MKAYYSAVDGPAKKRFVALLDIDIFPLSKLFWVRSHPFGALPSLCLYACNNWTNAERISTEFDTGEVCDKQSSVLNCR